MSGKRDHFVSAGDGGMMVGPYTRERAEHVAEAMRRTFNGDFKVVHEDDEPEFFVKKHTGERN